MVSNTGNLKMFSLGALLFSVLLQGATVSAGSLTLTGEIDSVTSNTKSGITTSTAVSLELSWALDSLVSSSGESTVSFNEEWSNIMTLSIGDYVITDTPRYGEMPTAHFTDGILDDFSLVWYEASIDGLTGTMWAIEINGQGSGATADIALEIRDDGSPNSGDWIKGSFDYPTASVVACTTGTIDAEMTRLSYDITEIPQAGSTVTFTAQGMSRLDETLYYRFDLIPNYGTTDYDPFNNYQTLQDFSTSNTLTHDFDTAGDYILVVFTSPTASIQSGNVSIMGGSISVGSGNNIQINLLDYDVTSSINLDDTVTFSLGGVAGDSGDIYYRFDLISNYGTSDYDPFNDYETLQDFSTSSTLSHTFDSPGDYILVVFASSSLTVESGATPIIGGSIHINCDE